MSAVAELDTGLIERTCLGISTPTQACAGKSLLIRVFLNSAGAVRVYDARDGDDLRAASLVYYSSRPGPSDVLDIPCSRGVFVVPDARAVCTVHYWGVL